MIQLDTERYWLYAVVDAATNRLLHARLFPTRTQVLTEIFLERHHQKHLDDDAVFFIDKALVAISAPSPRAPILA